MNTSTTQLAIIPPAEAFIGLEVPERCSEISEELMSCAAALTDAFVDVDFNRARLSDEVAQSQHMQPSLLGEDMLSCLENEGKLDPDMRKFITENASSITRLMSSKGDRPSNLIDDFVSYAMAFDLTGSHREAKKSTPQRTRVVVSSITEIVDNVGEPLLDNVGLKTQTKALNQQINEINSSNVTAQEKAKLFKALNDDRGSIDILKTMWAIDCIAHAASTPEPAQNTEIFEHPTRTVGTNDSAAIDKTRRGILIGLGANAFTDLLDEETGGMAIAFEKLSISLYGPQVFNAFGKPKRKFKDHVNRTLELIGSCLDIKAFESAQILISAESKMGVVSNIHSSSEHIDRLAAEFNAQMSEIRNTSYEHLRSAPSPERMLAALAIETWTASLSRETSELWSGPVDAKPRYVDETPLHDLLDAHEQEQNGQRTVKLNKLIAEYEQHYEITSRHIRGLEGGLELRKQLETWTDPGSQRQIFSKNKAQTLSGIAIESGEYPDLAQDVFDMETYWAELSQLDDSAKRNGLLGAIDTLREAHEAATPNQLNNRQLKPLWKLIDVIDSRESIEAETEVTPLLDEEFPYSEQIKPFPPENKDIDIEDIIEDLKDILSTTQDSHPIEWERIYSLVKLHRHIEEKGYPVAAVRLAASEWHPLPHYALEIKGKGDDEKVISIVESPVYGNATYLIAMPEWREIVDFSKKEARELGAVPRVHAEGKTSTDHRTKLLNDVLTALQ